MKFSSFKEFRGNIDERTSTIEQMVMAVMKYLTVDQIHSLRELSGGLTKLSFQDNFEAFEVTVTLAAGAELGIRNELRGVTPSKRLIVKGTTGSQDIVDGDTAWTQDFVYLKNSGATTATATVIFFR